MISCVVPFLERKKKKKNSFASFQWIKGILERLPCIIQFLLLQRSNSGAVGKMKCSLYYLPLKKVEREALINRILTYQGHNLEDQCDTGSIRHCIQASMQLCMVFSKQISAHRTLSPFVFTFPPLTSSVTVSRGWGQQQLKKALMVAWLCTKPRIMQHLPTHGMQCSFSVLQAPSLAFNGIMKSCQIPLHGFLPLFSSSANCAYILLASNKHFQHLLYQMLVRFISVMIWKACSILSPHTPQLSESIYISKLLLFPWLRQCIPWCYYTLVS